MLTEGKLIKDRYYSGTSGLVLPVPNKACYPAAFQDKSRLSYYASLFNSIEVNSSFYKIPQAKTMAKWASEVTDKFRFTFKLWQGITHEKGLSFNPGDILRFMNSINEVGNHKGCLLLQFPPSVKIDLMPQLQHLINCVLSTDANRSWNLALEFRHSSWYNDQIGQFAADNQLTIVLQDIPASATPISFVNGDIVYVRFHGPGGKYRGSYPDDVLQEYNGYIDEWQAEGKTVYVYFNNTMGDAVQNLATLNSYVLKGF